LNGNNIKRQRRIEIRWTGDEVIERAVLYMLGVDDADIATGNYERWTQISARLAGVVCIAIEAAGSQIVEPK